MKREPISKSLRFEVFKRDGFACQYCGAKAPKAVLHADHIQPVAAGGRSRISNLVTACEACNLGKGDREGASPHVDLVAKAQGICDAAASRYGRGYNVTGLFATILRCLEMAAENGRGGFAGLACEEEFFANLLGGQAATFAAFADGVEYAHDSALWGRE